MLSRIRVMLSRIRVMLSLSKHDHIEVCAEAPFDKLRATCRSVSC
jgi:hypothetical protein